MTTSRSTIHDRFAGPSRHGAIGKGEKGMMTRGESIGRALAAVALVGVLSVGAYASDSNRESSTMVAASATNSMGPMQVPGVNLDNFGVVDGRIYRGEQPKANQYAELKAIGIATVVDLRDDAKAYARTSAEAAGLKYVNIPMDDHDIPTDEQIATFLATVTDEGVGKVYVHCAGGRHRTGATIATYRMAVGGWTIDQAYGEMKAYDFYTRFGHGGYKDYVYDYYKRLKADPASVPTPSTLRSAETAAVTVASTM
jgi:protein tyrosine/serine phosphatase